MEGAWGEDGCEFEVEDGEEGDEGGDEVEVEDVG